jgi:hypothetical protein
VGREPRARLTSPISSSLAVADVREGPCGCGWGRHIRAPAVCWSGALLVVATVPAVVVEAAAVPAAAAEVVAAAVPAEVVVAGVAGAAAGADSAG